MMIIEAHVCVRIERGMKEQQEEHEKFLIDFHAFSVCFVVSNFLHFSCVFLFSGQTIQPKIIFFADDANVLSLLHIYQARKEKVSDEQIMSYIKWMSAYSKK